MNRSVFLWGGAILLASPLSAHGQEISVDVLGNVTVQEGAYIIETGEQSNESNIKLPSILPSSVSEGVRVPTQKDILAPSSLNVSVDDEYVVDSVTQATGLTVVDYDVRVTSQIDTRPGSHSYAEGLKDDDELVLVRGSRVRHDLDGNPLPETATINSEFGRGETAEIEVVNLRPHANELSDSGVYFTESGDVIVEDLQNGGNNPQREPDFDDADVDIALRGRLVADLEGFDTEDVTEVSVAHWELQPAGISNVLGFVDEEGNATDSNRISATSEGHLEYSYQTRPLFSLRRPTLVGVSLEIDPFAGNNDESASLTIGATQFLTPIYDDVERKRLSDSLLVLPPVDEAANGLAAYHNIGGFIVNYTDGTSDFVPQWTVEDRLTQTLVFNAKEVESFVQALLPEQEGTDAIEIGTTIPLKLGSEGYSTAFGQRLIDRDTYPENFQDVSPLLAAVEDTLDTGNTAVYEFDGIRREGTVDFNDAFVSLETERPLETYTERGFRRTGLYIGANATVGVGNRETTTTTTRTDTYTRGQGVFGINGRGELHLRNFETTQSTESYIVGQDTSSHFDFTPLRAEGVLGAVWNYAGNPWTEQASTARLELYAGDDSGLRSELRANVLNSNTIPFLRADWQFEDDVIVSGGITYSF